MLEKPLILGISKWCTLILGTYLISQIFLSKSLTISSYIIWKILESIFMYSANSETLFVLCDVFEILVELNCLFIHCWRLCVKGRFREISWLSTYLNPLGQLLLINHRQRSAILTMRSDSNLPINFDQKASNSVLIHFVSAWILQMIIFTMKLVVWFGQSTLIYFHITIRTNLQSNLQFGLIKISFQIKIKLNKNHD